MRQTEIFYQLMNSLQKHGVLNNVILIGSWCQFFYKEYFGHTPHIPTVRTVDIDFLIPNPPRIENKVNVNELLIQLGFEERTDYMSGLSKFSHEDLVVEFLFPEQGKGKKEPYEIKEYQVNAVGLRFLNLLQSHVLKIERDNLIVKVPEPAAFVLHKHIISTRRKNIEKREKDRETAIEIGDYLLQSDEQRNKLIDVYRSMPSKWQKTLLTIVKEFHIEMYTFLEDKQ